MAIGSVFVFGRAVFLFVRKRPWRAVSVLAVVLVPTVLWVPLNQLNELVHLGLTAGLGVGQLAQTLSSDNEEFAVYDWSIGLAGGPNTFLIHDVTDEIALPMAQHKRPASFEQGFGEDCAGNVRHLVGHYFICTI